MKLIANILKAAFATLIVVGVASQAMAAIDIKLRDRVSPRASVVRLSDVAEIATADRQQARKLGAVPLMPAPAPGTERFLQRREILDMLSAHGVDVGTLRFAGAARVQIASADAPANPSKVIQASAETEVVGRPAPMNRHAAILAGVDPGRASAAVSLDEARANDVRKQVKGLIADYLNTKAGKAQTWKVECEPSDRELVKLDAAQSTLVCSGGSEPWVGRQRFLITFTTSDGQVQLPIFAEIAPPPVPAIVAIRPIGRGDVVKAADIELRMVDANPKAFGQHVLAGSVEKLIGMEARQALQAGDIVFTDSVQSPIVVRRGETITVISQSGGIRVRTTGRALRDASRGDLVEVEALGSKQKYDARVVGTREAVVYSAARPDSPEPPKRLDTARRTGVHQNGMLSR